MSDDLATWLRRRIESGLGEWREREAHFLAVREREGDYHYFEARERVAHLETELAILDEHLPRQDEERCGICISERTGYEEEWPDDRFPCRTLRLLASGYRHRSGYQEEEWKP
jgi:hypothetical protein